MNANDSAFRPTPYELAVLAISLGGQAALLRGSDATAEDALANALRIWKLAHGVAMRGGTELDIEENALRRDAAEFDAVRELRERSPDEVVSWSDVRLLAALNEKAQNPGISDFDLGERLYDRWRKRLKRAGRSANITAKSAGIKFATALADLTEKVKSGPSPSAPRTPSRTAARRSGHKARKPE